MIIYYLISVDIIYTREDYKILEMNMLKMFDFDVMVPTATTFCAYYVEFIVDENDFNSTQFAGNFDAFKENVKMEAFRLSDNALFGKSI